MELTEKAKKLMDAYNKSIEIEWDSPLSIFQQKISCSDGFEYGIFDGGYIKPEDIISGNDLIKLEKALLLVEEFKNIWEKIALEM